MNTRVLVTDFDGTMTGNDFYKLVADRLLSADALAPWQDYRAGAITHFEALRRIFAAIRAPEAHLQAVIQDMEPDPLLAESVRTLRQHGWDVVVASAGCQWYIDQILTQAGLDSGPDKDLEVYANPGSYNSESGLTMRRPDADLFFSPETGVDKRGIVRFHQDQGKTVAFAGDGFADLPAALQTTAKLRFARADLAASLDKAGQPYRPFSRWADVAQVLLTWTGPA